MTTYTSTRVRGLAAWDPQFATVELRELRS